MTHSHLHADRGRLPSYVYVRVGLVYCFSSRARVQVVFPWAPTGGTGVRMVAAVPQSSTRWSMSCCADVAGSTGSFGPDSAENALSPAVLVKVAVMPGCATTGQTVVPQLQFIEGRRLLCCTAEADPHGLVDHRDSAVAVWARWTMSLVYGSCRWRSLSSSQLLLFEKFVVCLEVLTGLFTQTLECLGTARGVQFLDKVVDVPVVVMTGACCCQCRKVWSSCSVLTS